MSKQDIKGTALITGASSGIGAVYADRLARRGSTTETRSIMQAKLKYSAAVLGALLSAVGPAIAHAESQQEWFLRQLQMTDSYTPETSTAAPMQREGNTSMDSKAAKGVEGRAGSVGVRKEAGGGSALVGNPKNYYNGFSPYASDPQYSP